MPTTPNKGLRYPSLTDTPDVPRDVGNLATDLDNVANFYSGTLVQRNAFTAKAGDVWWVTNDDTMGSAGTPYVWQGGAWRLLTYPKDPAAATGGARTLGTGANQAAAGNDARLSDQRVPTDNSVTTTKLVNNAVTLAKVANGLGSRLIHASLIPAFSIGSNVFQAFGSNSVVHSGKPAFAIYWHTLTVSGASPYGFALRLLLDGNNTGEASGNDFASLNTPQQLIGMYNSGSLSGSHSWQVRAESGNNPNTFRSPGGSVGALLIFEQY